MAGKILECVVFFLVMIGVIVGCFLATVAFLVYLLLSGFMGKDKDFYTSSPIKFQRRWL